MEPINKRSAGPSVCGKIQCVSGGNYCTIPSNSTCTPCTDSAYGCFATSSDKCSCYSSFLECMPNVNYCDVDRWVSIELVIHTFVRQYGVSVSVKISLVVVHNRLLIAWNVTLDYIAIYTLQPMYVVHFPRQVIALFLVHRTRLYYILTQLQRNVEIQVSLPTLVFPIPMSVSNKIAYTVPTLRSLFILCNVLRAGHTCTADSDCLSGNCTGGSCVGALAGQPCLYVHINVWYT